MVRVNSLAVVLYTLISNSHSWGNYEDLGFIEPGKYDGKAWDGGLSAILNFNRFAENEDFCNAVYSCLDCHTARICRLNANGRLVPVETVICPTNKPFCRYRTGTCEEFPDSRCKRDKDYMCVRDGYFPGENCQLYYYCQGRSKIKFKCTSPSHSFDPRVRGCRSSGKCGKFNCIDEGRKVSHSEYPEYYLYCRGPGEASIVDQCPEGYQMNNTSQLCQSVEAITWTSFINIVTKPETDGLDQEDNVALETTQGPTGQLPTGFPENKHSLFPSRNEALALEDQRLSTSTTYSQTASTPLSTWIIDIYEKTKKGLCICAPTMHFPKIRIPTRKIPSLSTTIKSQCTTKTQCPHLPTVTKYSLPPTSTKCSHTSSIKASTTACTNATTKCKTVATVPATKPSTLTSSTECAIPLIFALRIP